jgi:hypothetical protein
LFCWTRRQQDTKANAQGTGRAKGVGAASSACTVPKNHQSCSPDIFGELVIFVIFRKRFTVSVFSHSPSCQPREDHGKPYQESKTRVQRGRGSLLTNGTKSISFYNARQHLRPAIVFFAGAASAVNLEDAKQQAVPSFHFYRI